MEYHPELANAWIHHLQSHIFLIYELFSDILNHLRVFLYGIGDKYSLNHKGYKVRCFENIIRLNDFLGHVIIK